MLCSALLPVLILSLARALQANPVDQQVALTGPVRVFDKWSYAGCGR